ncbi:hypothetical protein [Microlunatus sp. GCM10028923]
MFEGLMTVVPLEAGPTLAGQGFGAMALISLVVAFLLFGGRSE